MTRASLLPSPSPSSVVALALMALGLLSPRVASCLPATQVVAGSAHTCVLNAAGSVLCWGDNTSGQLGDGTTIARRTPTQVSGLTSGVVALAAGNSHTCAVTKAGALQCWGRNFEGQLGDGTTAASLTPVTVTGLSSGVAAVTAGNSHTCVVTTAGSVQCWGYNAYGQVGDGSGENQSTPVTVGGITTAVASVTAGDFHTCALTTAGAVWCWGENGTSQLGDGTTDDQTTPVPVVGLATVIVAVTAGTGHTCVLTLAGAVQCWGFNGNGQLGDGTTTAQATPIVASGHSSEVASVEIGGSLSCVVTTGRAARCWGANGLGQLGDGTTTQRLTSVAVVGLDAGVSSIDVGSYHACALTTGGAVRCWGYNGSGQLGDGTTTNRNSPVAVGTLDGRPPTVSRISPGRGPQAGGTVVTVVGTNFVAGQTAVRIGGTLATDVTIADSSLRNVALAGSGGVAAQSSTYSWDCYTYYGNYCGTFSLPASLAIDGVTTTLNPNFPGGGSTSGTIEELNPWWEVTFDADYPITSIVLAHCTYNCRGGTLPVTVSLYTESGDLAWTRAGTTGQTVFPVNGVVARRLRVRVVDSIARVLELREVQAFTLVGAATLTAVTAAHASGLADVTVTGTDGSATLSGGFTFVGPLPSFTDNPLVARSTPVKLVHVSELRQRIDELRIGFGLGGFAWTDAVLQARVTPVRALHLSELRTALDAVYVAANRLTPTYSNVPLIIRTTVVTVAQIEELRAAVAAVW
jgi:alpha-tubulin suppressor-like RCC1 family protein